MTEPTRRRYDTTALIDQMKLERRRGLAIGGAAAIIFIGLVAAYFVVLDDDRIPEVPVAVRKPTPAPPAKPEAAAAAAPAPTPALATATPAPAAADTATPAPAGAAAAGGDTAPAGSGPDTTAATGPTAAPAVPAPAPTGPTLAPDAEASPPPADAAKAKVEVVLALPSPLWIDEAAIGKVKHHAAELAAGKHKLRAKLGKRDVVQVLNVKPGEHFVVRFDPKKKTALVKKL